MSEAVSLVRRDGPWGWDAAGARYLCADGLEAGAPEPEVLGFLLGRLLELASPAAEAQGERIALVFADAASAQKAWAALIGHRLYLPQPSDNRIVIGIGAGFSRQNAALLIEMLSEVMLDLRQAPSW